MSSALDRPTMSGNDAAARLSYLSGIQARTRRALLMPSYALVALGAIVAVHGALAAIWPHAEVASLAWVGAAIASRPMLRWLRQRIAERRGVDGTLRLRLRSAAAALAAGTAAVLLGANSLISAIAVATALPAYLAGLRSIALAALLVGVVGDIMAAQDVSATAAQIVFGAGLVAVGLVCRAREQEHA
jgi:hypothetical protein